MIIIQILFNATTVKVGLLDQSVCGDGTWEKFLVEEQKDILVGEEKLEDFSLITCGEMFIFNGLFKTVIFLLGPFMQHLVEVAIAS